MHLTVQWDSSPLICTPLKLQMCSKSLSTSPSQKRIASLEAWGGWGLAQSPGQKNSAKAFLFSMCNTFAKKKPLFQSLKGIGGPLKPVYIFLKTCAACMIYGYNYSHSLWASAY